jgi:hypothetical protein
VHKRNDNRNPFWTKSRPSQYRSMIVIVTVIRAQYMGAPPGRT